MAHERSQITGAVGDTLVQIKGATNSVEDNITGSGTPNMHQVSIDASNNAGEDCFARFFDAASGVSLGTDDAEVLLWGPKGKVTPYNFPFLGIPFAAGISPAVVSSKGATSGTAKPSGTVNMTVFATA